MAKSPRRFWLVRCFSDLRQCQVAVWEVFSFLFRDQDRRYRRVPQIFRLSETVNALTDLLLAESLVKDVALGGFHGLLYDELLLVKWRSITREIVRINFSHRLSGVMM